MLPPRAKIQPAVRATRPGWSGPCNKATSVSVFGMTVSLPGTRRRLNRKQRPAEKDSSFAWTRTDAGTCQKRVTNGMHGFQAETPGE
jgi:hypothetical protein